MIASLLFYLQEMIAALTLFAAFFVVASGAVLILYVLDSAYKRAFDWAEAHLKSFFRFAFRLRQSRYSGNDSNEYCSVGFQVILWKLWHTWTNVTPKWPHALTISEFRWLPYLPWRRWLPSPMLSYISSRSICGTAAVVRSRRLSVLKARGTAVLFGEPLPFLGSDPDKNQLEADSSSSRDERTGGLIL
jgi:hypothetical protein